MFLIFLYSRVLKFPWCKYDVDALWYCHKCDKGMFWIFLNIFNWLIRAGKGSNAATKYFPQCFYYLVFRIFWLPPRISISMSASKSNLCEKTENIQVKKFLFYLLRSWSMKPLKNVEMKASIFLCGIWVSVSGDCLNILCRNDVPGDPREQLLGCYDHNGHRAWGHNPTSHWPDTSNAGLLLAD